ncbi:CBU_0592 family membrane protein [Alterisphingorhabdus coralli]|uniref:CBU-0592-like domain-containing protein n=1 Tax=Alterisphingorhabdus coralli TaxID=3071408 RepID=A0AA97HZP8_9SPHN|nr:hypothetical protein [Parasphingorhabdus sp. SCSIO 66989]WOE74959.1 hypothetical protein RB602_14140 [Parasphingorhabdus sp. SCSIO 66989]
MMLADIVGWMGTSLIVFAYFYANVLNKPLGILYNCMNILGSLLLAWSLTVNINWAAFSLQIVWIIISLFGIWRVLRSRKDAKEPA